MKQTPHVLVSETLRVSYNPGSSAASVLNAPGFERIEY
jgi:hypothetical protein